MNLDITPYQSDWRDEWDEFVLKESVNGTVFHTRNFLSYHPDDRFEDTSIIVCDGDTIACVVPACKDDHGSFSHAGSSYGGPVVHPDYYRVKRLSKIVDSILDHYDDGFEMRVAPSIFGRRLNDPIVYMVGRTHRVVRELSVYKDLRVNDLLESFRSSRTRTTVRSAFEEGFVAEPTNDVSDYQAFYEILEDNLAYHGVTPTHTLEELIDLKDRLDSRQTLVVGRDAEGHLVSGTWLVKASDTAWHNFYIAKDYDQGGHEATPCVLYRSMTLAKETGSHYLNFGICTEDGGKTMNIGLFDFKESLGGETINRYKLLLDE
ncbi:hypothetical protein [Salinibacter ruber]|uniref:hypothetical protein n=1 Tax=Salinibacter ruber TaxID=146919 RepID=UPI00160BE718|nr:hypothetical protein [Salinibacter ruber]MBB4062661.1 hypothetical protein [Salinibacter ruber]